MAQGNAINVILLHQQIFLQNIWIPLQWADARRRPMQKKWQTQFSAIKMGSERDNIDIIPMF